LRSAATTCLILAAFCWISLKRAWAKPWAREARAISYVLCGLIASRTLPVVTRANERHKIADPFTG
jgi:hypothetical protein